MPPKPPTIDPALLHALLQSRAPLTPQALGQRLSLGPIAAARRIDALRTAGCTIESNPQRGVTLISTGLACWTDYIEHRHANRLGRSVHVYTETTSTQDLAKKLIASRGDHDGRIILANHQTAGRGRLGRKWLAAPGAALLLTAIVRCTGLTIDRLMLASCCAAAEAAEQFIDADVQIRWPNDLLIADRKLAGILVETVGDLALIGIGLNVASAPTNLPGQNPHATSLADHGPATDRLTVLDTLLDHLHRAIHSDTDAALRKSWHDRACLLQQRITAQTGSRRITGRVIDIDPAQGLVLATEPAGIITLPAATTSLVLD